SRFADTRGIADHAYNAAVLRGFEVRRDSIATMDRAIETGVDLAMPVFRLGLDETLPQRQAGIVDENIEPAEILRDLVNHRLNRRKIGDIRLVGLGLDAFRRDLGNQRIGFLVRAAVVDRNIRPLCRQAERDLAPDPVRRARHESGLALQSQIHDRPFSFSRARADSIRRNNRSGVTGSSLISMPSGDSASLTAFAIAAGEPIVPPSPMPRKPPSVVGDSDSRWTTRIGGISHADGTR